MTSEPKTTESNPGAAVVTVSGPMTSEQKPAKPKKPPAAVVTVVAKQASRWRIGRQFGPVPVDIPAAELSEDDLARLRADPLLVVLAGSDALTAEVAHPQK